MSKLNRMIAEMAVKNVIESAKKILPPLIKQHLPEVLETVAKHVDGIDISFDSSDGDVVDMIVLHIHK